MLYRIIIIITKNLASSLYLREILKSLALSAIGLENGAQGGMLLMRNTLVKAKDHLQSLFLYHFLFPHPLLLLHTPRQQLLSKFVEKIIKSERYSVIKRSAKFMS